jgi:hypothetical protein
LHGSAAKIRLGFCWLLNDNFAGLLQENRNGKWVESGTDPFQVTAAMPGLAKEGFAG